MTGRVSFERAVASYELRELALPANALAVASASLERTGLFLLGEIHGVAQTPLAILALVTRLGIRTLAFEWSYDELDEIVQPVLSTGRIDLDALWKLPPSAEVFSGDGRFTAGHVRLLEHLSGRVGRIVLLDRVGSEGQEREIGMARRLLDDRRPESRMLAILGAAHVIREPFEELEPVGRLVEHEVSGVANGMLVPAGAEQLPTDVVFPIGPPVPAVVPIR
jgi:hypothetical protein